MIHANQFARKLIVEYLDGTPAKAFKLSVKADIHQVNSILFNREGRHPAMLTIIDGVAQATYEVKVNQALSAAL
jgi:hypothetical protein